MDGIQHIAIPTNLPWLHSNLLLILNFLSFYFKIYMFVHPCLLTIRMVKMLQTISTRVWRYPSQDWLQEFGATLVKIGYNSLALPQSRLATRVWRYPSQDWLQEFGVSLVKIGYKSLALPQSILAILFTPFGFLAQKDVDIVWL